MYTNFHAIILWLGKWNKAEFSIPGDTVLKESKYIVLYFTLLYFTYFTYYT